MNAQFDEISRKAATGELSRAERDWLDKLLLEHPGKRADLEWDEALCAKLADKVASMPAMPGWDRTEQALRVTNAGSRVRRPDPARTPGILDRLSEWLQSTIGIAINVQAIAAALVLAQAGVIGALVWQDYTTEFSQMRAGGTDALPRGQLLRVSFRESIREADLRRALAEIDGEIVAGPGQIGVYLVRVKSGELDAAAERLRATGMTELVEMHEVKR